MTIKEMPDSITPPQKPILFFDGHCVLCNRSIDFLMKRDRYKKLYYASLQGESARHVLPAALQQQMTSVVLYDQGKFYQKTEALLNIIHYLPLRYRWWKVMGWIPRPLRDRLYDYIARKRYAWFGRNPQCRMPSDEERDRMLP
ncbi:MAG: DUF393 domain-containing protein [Calditrichaeota bacterium]|nr:MAG: DUF393 domain-containing protein [Calditrichota bacterium]